MSTIPTWLAATAGAGLNSGIINQFLSAHNTAFLYSGAQIISQQATGSGTFQGTLGQWNSQLITTGNSQTALGSVNLQLAVVGGSPTLPLVPTLTVALYADSGGFPTGSALASVLLSNNYVYNASFWVAAPIGVTVTPSTQYHIVLSAVGSTGHYYVWQQSNQTSGAATAPDGATWTNRAFGFMYQMLDQTSTGLLTAISEDNGALLTTLTYNAQNEVSSITQFATAQGGGYIQSSGTLSYTNGLLTGVS